MVHHLLRESDAIVFKLDKMGYASDLASSEEVLSSSVMNQNHARPLNKWNLTTRRQSKEQFV